MKYPHVLRALSARLRRLSRPGRLIVGGVVALVIGLGGGTAYAFFAGTGSGSGVALTGSTQTVTIDAATGSTTTKLYPGITPAADLTITLDNPNKVAIIITAISAGSGGVTGSGGVGTCTTTGVSVVPSTTLNITIPANVTGYTFDVPQSVTMGAASDTGCQGATFHVPVNLAAQVG